MADNNNPFDHPVKKNNWWLYILGGLCFAGLIIWFFIDWSYKDRDKTPEPTEQVGAGVQPTETLPDVTVEGEEGVKSTDSIAPLAEPVTQ